jgi:hypothetical protein
MEMTTCEYDGDIKSWNCATEEQCDDCFMIDHQKECGWCEFYDHAERKLEVQHDMGERTFEAHVVTPFEMLDAAADEALGYIIEQEQKWGEERAANQD